MATLYVSEFSDGVSGIGTYVAPILPQPSLADQTVAIGVSSTQSAAFQARTKAILISTDTACHIKIGADPTASDSTFYLPANGIPLAFGVVGGQKIAVIT